MALDTRLAQYLDGEEQALSDTQQAVVMEPENWRAWLVRAEVLMTAEHWRGALYAARRASNLLPHGSTAIGSRLAEVIRTLEQRLVSTRGG